MKRTLALIILLVYAPAHAQIGRGVVTGLIRAADGKPAAGVRVAAMEIPGGNVEAVATSLLASIAETDRSGKYRLEDLPPGRYYIVAGKLDTPTYYPGSKTAANAKAVSVAAGMTVPGIDFTATPPLRVTGRIIGLNDAAPGGIAPDLSILTGENMMALRSVRSTDPGAAFTASGQQLDLRAFIAPDGSFEFREVPPGAYMIALPGLRQDYMVLIPGVSTTNGPSTIVVVERDVTDVMVMFPGHITGDVVVDQDGPAPSFTLTFTESGKPPIQASVSSAAPIQVALAMGSYRVSVSGLAKGYSVKSIEYGSADVFHGPLLMTEANNPATRFVVTLGVSNPPPWVRVSGHVSGPGRPAAVGPLMFGISSTALGLEFQTQVQQDGSFEFARVPKGTTYEAWFDPEPDGINPIAIVVGQSDLTAVEINLPDRAKVSGRVIVDDDAPLPAGQIRLIGTGAPRATGGGEMLAVERALSPVGDGSFQTVLPEGEYRVTMAAAAPYAIRSMTDGTVNLLTEPLRVTGAGAKEISVAFSVMTFAVRGRIISGGRNLPDRMRVAISGTGLTVTHYAFANADGTFEFPKVPPGTYAVRVGQDGMPISIVVTAGDVSGIDFGLLRGRVTFPSDAAPPPLVLALSNGGAAVGSYVRPDIRADGAFEVALPLGEYRGHLAGYLPEYVLKLAHDGKSDVINEVEGFQFSSRDEVELQVVFQP